MNMGINKYTLNTLQNSETLGKIWRALRLRDLIDQILLKIPWIKQTSTGVKYRLERVDAIFLAEAVFWGNYLDAIIKYNMPFTTFADIGSNRGFFTLYLMHLARLQGLSQPRGICIDANKEMVRVSQENFELNNIPIMPDFGIVGVDSQDGESNVDFYINPADMSSSVFTPGKKVSVPILNANNIWISKIGQEPCDLLKVDIEGSESKFLDHEHIFVQNARSAIIEFHEPMSLRKDIEAKMNNLGFNCVGFEPGLVWPELRGDLYFIKK